MKILVIHYNDDNFGDVLIRTCFEQILKVVMENLEFSDSDYEISSMGLKNPDLDSVSKSDMVFFAGGGLFGLSYLSFFEPMKAILERADKDNIPVVFSSIGVNNMDLTEENEQPLFDLFKMSCIKAVSVRENAELFKRYAGSRNFSVCQVCDPAVWTRYVYANSLDGIIEAKEKSEKKVIGLNVVRGGLFADNGKKWYLNNEVDYLFEVKKLFENAGYECKFYTNGSTLDNNAMLFLKDKFEVPENQLVFVDSTEELVKTVAEFSGVAAIRMHSSIICYAMNIPSVNLVWNDKIPLFYQATDFPEGTVEAEEWTAENVFGLLSELLQNKTERRSEKYLMSLYAFLYNTVSDICGGKTTSGKYAFSDITEKLKALNIPAKNNLQDMKTKLYQGEKRYFSQFMQLRSSNSEIKTLKKDSASKDGKIKKQEKKIETQAEKIRILQSRLDKINRMLVVRIYRKLKRTMKKAVSIFKKS